MGFKSVLTVCCILCCCCFVKSQGLYTDYGQNRIQYSQFNWKIIANENIELLYYGGNEEVAKLALGIAKEELLKLESYLAYKYGGNMQILLFKNLNDYRQSNIGYTNPQFNSGGYFYIPNDNNSVYFNGNYHYLTQQITNSICDIILREMIYGGSLQDRFERVKSSALPTWFTAGLCKFMSEGWTAETETQYRDALIEAKFNHFNVLDNDDQALAGVGIWRYLVEKYGAESVSTILFIARYTRSAESAIYFHTKKTIAQFFSDVHNFYIKELNADLTEQLPKGKSNVPQRISSEKNTEFALNPQGNKVAIVTNDQGRFYIWEYDLNSNKIRQLYAGGLKVLNQIPDYNFPKIFWNEKTEVLFALVYKDGNYNLIQFTNNKSLAFALPLVNFDGINDFAFDKDGKNIYLSAVKNGQANIWKYNIESKNLLQLTNDLFFDFNPVSCDDGGIIFISNRPVSPELPADVANTHYNLFKILDGKTIAITNFTSNVNISHPICYDEKSIGFLCDLNGLKNAYFVHLDSGKRVYALTNYQRGIDGQSISANRNLTAEMLKIRGQNILFTGEVPKNPADEAINLKRLPWKNRIANLDSIFKARNEKSAASLNPFDSAQMNEKDSGVIGYVYQTGFEKIDYKFNADLDSLQTKTHYLNLPFVNSLQPDFLFTQLDNRVLGSYAFSNRIKHEELRSPFLMPFVKVTLSDLMKNYLIEAGFRTSFDLLKSDYIARFSLLKYRFDHDFTLTRHVRIYDEISKQTLQGNKRLQNLSVQANYSISYPFSSNARLTAGVGLRRELLSTKLLENNSLLFPDKNEVYANGRIEYNYDNTTSLGLNRVVGLRIKTGLEFYQRIQGKSYGNIVNYYLDARHYLKLGRALIWANRITAAYSFGKAKTAYYLGGVENWMVPQQFEKSTQWLNNPQYYFQQWVCNLRGFARGIRVGSNFALLNSELRYPLFLDLIRKPTESEFLRNFTLTAFLDFGTAFVGNSPSDPSNPFNTVYYSTPNYTLSVTSRRNPWVMGNGFGVRTRILGYILKYDLAYGFADNQWSLPINYFSIGFDF